MKELFLFVQGDGGKGTCLLLDATLAQFHKTRTWKDITEELFLTRIFHFPVISESKNLKIQTAKTD